MLPSDMRFLERGWLSSNSLLLLGPDETALIDSGYFTHADQTVELVRHALAGRTLNRLFNTHLHSDHCGGNAAIQMAWPDSRTLIPPGSADAVREWNEDGLTFRPTGQFCPTFTFHQILPAGSHLMIASRRWDIHAAPGHDPDSVLLFQPDTGVLLSADALWEHGFGVVFPEIVGEPGFSDVGRTLDLIEQLQPKIIVPGHGRVFTDLTGALSRARERLHLFMNDPLKHASHAAKVLIKFHMMAIQECSHEDLLNWCDSSSYLHLLQRTHYAQFTMHGWTNTLIDSLVKSGALLRQNDHIHNC